MCYSFRVKNSTEKKPLKVLFVITKGNWGGAQRYVFDLATSLPPHEFSVSVAFGQPGDLSKKLADAIIQTHPITSLARDISLGKELRSFFELYRLFKKEKPDIVHLNSSKAGGLGALAARLAGIQKIIFTAHGWPFGEKRSALTRTMFWIASWITALLSHKIICVSEHDLKKAQIMPFVGKKSVRIYNGIKPEHVESGDIIRRAFPNGAVITGTIGELNKNKNQIALLEEARKDPTMYIAIVGEGEERKNLERAIEKYNLSDRVKLFGFRPARDVLKGFNEFALPSIKEGLPYVLLEAKMAGLPIKANRVGGIGEILDKDISEFSLEHMVSETMALYQS